MDIISLNKNHNIAVYKVIIISLSFLVIILSVSYASNKADPNDYGQSPNSPVDGRPIVMPQGAFDQWTCAREYRENKENQKRVCELLNYHLQVAQELIKDDDIDKQRTGLGIILGIASYTSDVLNDYNLASKICEEYIIPNIGLAYEEKWKYPNRDTILESVILIWNKLSKSNDIITTYNFWLKLEEDLIQENKDKDIEKSKNRVDWIRFSLAAALANSGYYKNSINCLENLDDKSDLNGAKLLINDIKQKEKNSQISGVKTKQQKSTKKLVKLTPLSSSMALVKYK